MSKDKDQRHKAKVENKAKKEAFRFQVQFARKQNTPAISEDAPELLAEIETLCENDLNESILALKEIICGVRKELGVEPESDRCSLNGALVPFVLGITSYQPTDADAYVPGIFTAALPLQVTIAYDNAVRNKVMDWVKSKGYTTTTRLAQPIIKLPNMVVEVKRVVK